MEEKEKDLKELVSELIYYERHIANLWWSFLRGIASGLGFFVGSAIVATIIIYILTMLFRHSPVSSQFQDLMNTIKSVR